MIITDHAKERIVQRVENVDYFKDAKKVAKIAWRSGLTPYQVSASNSKLGNYMQEKKDRSPRSKVKLYKNNIYIWCGRTHRLATVYPAPEKLLKGE